MTAKSKISEHKNIIDNQNEDSSTWDASKILTAINDTFKDCGNHSGSVAKKAMSYYSHLESKHNKFGTSEVINGIESFMSTHKSIQKTSNSNVKIKMGNITMGDNMSINEKIRILLADGNSVSDIAKLLGKSNQRIQNIKKKEKLKGKL